MSEVRVVTSVNGEQMLAVPGTSDGTTGWLSIEQDDSLRFWGRRYVLMAELACHCGQKVVGGYDNDHPERHRGMCHYCDAARCDAYPGACGQPGAFDERTSA